MFRIRMVLAILLLLPAVASAQFGGFASNPYMDGDNGIWLGTAEYTFGFQGTARTYTFLDKDYTIGDVLKVGTPVDNQVGVWTGDGTIEGRFDFAYDSAATNDAALTLNPQSLTGGTALRVFTPNGTFTGRGIYYTDEQDPMTANSFSGWPFLIESLHTRTHTTGSKTENYDAGSILRHARQSGAGGTFVAQGSVLLLSHQATQTAGTLTDSVNVLELKQDTDSTGDLIFATLESTEVFSVDKNGLVFTASNLELGHASDTTISRVSAGLVAIEGDNIVDVGQTGTVTSTMILDGTITAADLIQQLARRPATLILVGNTTALTVTDGIGDFEYVIPESLNGWNLVNVEASVFVAGTTGTQDVQVHNVTDAADMLSTKITIDSTELSSLTAATPPVIDTGADDVSTGDRIRIDSDAIQTTPAQGLTVELTFQLP